MIKFASYLLLFVFSTNISISNSYDKYSYLCRLAILNNAHKAPLGNKNRQIEVQEKLKKVHTLHPVPVRLSLCQKLYQRCCQTRINKTS